jgi:hypothetical protein
MFSKTTVIDFEEGDTKVIRALNMLGKGELTSSVLEERLLQ